MQAVEFETEERNGIINIPQQILNKVKNHHLKIVMMYEEDVILDEKKTKCNFSEFAGMWEKRDISLNTIREKAWK